MLYLRGYEWNGHYAFNDIDEVAYASYIRALIDGRPRKNDPYSGRDERPEDPQKESLFSIQFAAPYTIALPARLLGIGTPWAMTLSGALAGLISALAGFWLLARLTGSNWYGMAGSLVIFAGGALAAGEGALPEILFDGFSYPYFPGFRRYIPAMAIAAVFCLFALVWKVLNAEPEKLNAESNSITSDEERKSETPDGHSALNVQHFTLILAAVFCFAYTVFSYFYIWTTAAAWLGCLFLVWLIFRPAGFRKDLRTLLFLGLGCMLALLPYGWLLSKRSETMDQVQLLVLTRAPDLWRVPEYISLVCLVLIAIGAALKIISLRQRSTLFALSLAMVPLVVFNQQIVTGRSLQPIHYQVFIGNYVAALALAFTVGTLMRKTLSNENRLTNVVLAGVSLLAILWGFVECHYTVRVLDGANVERDLALPVGKRLEELSRNDADPYRSTVLAYDMLQADDLPSIAPQNVLWARHQHVFAGLSWNENKERYFQYLYYMNVDDKGLDYLLKNDFVSKIALFGWGRHTDRLSSQARPLTYGEVDKEVRSYAEYRKRFNTAKATNPLLSYAVVNNEAGTDLTTLHRWYELDEGETIGKYTLYKLTLRPEPGLPDPIDQD